MSITFFFVSETKIGQNGQSKRQRPRHDLPDCNRQTKRARAGGQRYFRTVLCPCGGYDTSTHVYCTYVCTRNIMYRRLVKLPTAHATLRRRFKRN